MGQKDVQYAVEPVDGRDVSLEDETIFSRDAMALLDLRSPPCEFGNLRELAGIGTDADIGGDGQPELHAPGASGRKEQEHRPAG